MRFPKAPTMVPKMHDEMRLNLHELTLQSLRSGGSSTPMPSPMGAQGFRRRCQR